MTNASLHALLSHADLIVIDCYEIDSIDFGFHTDDGQEVVRCSMDDEDWFLRDERVELIDGCVRASASRDLGEAEEFHPVSIELKIRRPMTLADVQGA